MPVDPEPEPALFPIIAVTSPEQFEQYEEMGSKEKFWWRRAPDDERWLFKRARRGAGEAWSEKIAAALAADLGIPAAEAELAIDQTGRYGVALRDFASTRLLHHGNQLLARLVENYPEKARGKIKEHTVERVFEALNQLKIGTPKLPPPLSQLACPTDLFVGYLLLDAWIGNTDRHHENWGVLETNGRFELAPSYDHASSLGRELTDKRRETMLETRDPQQQVEAYADRARSAFFTPDDPQTQLSPLGAFSRAASLAPAAARVWLDRLRAACPSLPERILARIPDQVMSPIAREFVRRLLIHNRTTLEQSIEVLCCS